MTAAAAACHRDPLGGAARCFVPVGYAVMMTCLKDSQDPDEELRALVADHRGQPPARWPRPPRGWNTLSS